MTLELLSITETSEQHIQVKDNQTLSQNSHSEAEHLSCTNKDPISVNLMKKGYNTGHLNVRGLCGDKLSKSSEISLMLTRKENEKLHTFGMSETKLKIIR